MVSHCGQQDCGPRAAPFEAAVSTPTPVAGQPAIAALNPLTAISALDGRYRNKTEALAPIFSEFGLVRFRVLVECEWFLALAALPEAAELPAPSEAQVQAVRRIHAHFTTEQAAQVKAIEATTNHDVKAVEYFVKEAIGGVAGLAPFVEFVHFACTSEDINNLAHGLMLKAGRQVLHGQMERLIDAIDAFGKDAGHLPMLARTHGQPASPTTLAKELRVFSERLARRLEAVAATPLAGKLNGAVGNFNAHAVAYPNVDWPALSAKFITSLGLAPNPLTTQIEPHDRIAELFHAFMRFNQVLLDFVRDVWAYIAIDYFGQRPAAGETGSSTMPHKVNPIDFENAEGNLGVANALLGHMAEKLPVSRWQRDLSDSTVLRNMGSAFAHCSIAYQAAGKGIGKLAINEERIRADLDGNWEVLAEAVQTLMRKHGLAEPYERLKAATRGRKLDAAGYAELLDALDLPDAARRQLRSLRPEDYTGLAERLAAAKHVPIP